jgi:hypothetical protein
MGGILVAGNRRYDNAYLVCTYLTGQNMTRAEVTARDIAAFHRIPETRVPSISALLNFLQKNHIRNGRYGFFISGTQAFRKSGYPHRYLIELMERTHCPSARL